MLEDEPDLRPGTPVIEDCAADGKEDPESASEPPLTVSLSWEAPRHAVKENLAVIYHVEYFRDQWQLWLKGKTCRQPLCTLTGQHRSCSGLKLVLRGYSCGGQLVL